MDSDFEASVTEDKNKTLTDENNEAAQRNPDGASSDKEQAYIYTEKPIYKSTDAGEILGMSYNMVRYWARIYKEFLPDAINVEKGSGNLLLSSRDIDILRQISNHVKEGLTKERIMSILSDKSNKILDKPPIMSNDHFMELFLTDGFQEFMKYYTSNLIKQYQEAQNAKIDGLIEKINQFLEVSQTEPPLPSTNHEKELEKIYQQLEEKEQLIKDMKEAQKQLDESLRDLNSKLEEERKKSFFAKLFHRD